MRCHDHLKVTLIPIENLVYNITISEAALQLPT